ncbi:MAG TPA: methyltransferase domain-containing protein [Lacunisphaera sp.]|nr:methyltransferase domain-containing protein [Lacunisphaera sp.]
MRNEPPTPEVVAGIITDDDYVRARRQPRPGDSLYLHLADLRQAMALPAAAKPGCILDYGCGGSPYRDLFPGARYLRADLPDTTGTDYVIQPDGTIKAPDGQFDLVLSTQVLEHIAEPDNYLRECFRVLAPGGQLFLTTHGFYEEHACPNDFHRWTADGLRHDVEAIGFQCQEVHKLTTNGRAVLQLIEQYSGALFASRWHPFGMWLGIIRWLPSRWRAALHRWSDRFHGSYRVVPSTEPGHSFYLALAIRAMKPRGTAPR